MLRLRVWSVLVSSVICSVYLSESLWSLAVPSQMGVASAAIAVQGVQLSDRFADEWGQEFGRQWQGESSLDQPWFRAVYEQASADYLEYLIANLRGRDAWVPFALKTLLKYDLGQADPKFERVRHFMYYLVLHPSSHLSYGPAQLLEGALLDEFMRLFANDSGQLPFTETAWAMFKTALTLDLDADAAAGWESWFQDYSPMGVGYDFYALWVRMIEEFPDKATLFLDPILRKELTKIYADREMADAQKKPLMAALGTYLKPAVLSRKPELHPVAPSFSFLTRIPAPTEAPAAARPPVKAPKPKVADKPAQAAAVAVAGASRPKPKVAAKPMKAVDIQTLSEAELWMMLAHPNAAKRAAALNFLDASQLTALIDAHAHQYFPGNPVFVSFLPEAWEAIRLKIAQTYGFDSWEEAADSEIGVWLSSFSPEADNPWADVNFWMHELLAAPGSAAALLDNEVLDRLMAAYMDLALPEELKLGLDNLWAYTIQYVHIRSQRVADKLAEALHLSSEAASALYGYNLYAGEGVAAMDLAQIHDLLDVLPDLEEACYASAGTCLPWVPLEVIKAVFAAFDDIDDRFIQKADYLLAGAINSDRSDRVALATLYWTYDGPWSQSNSNAHVPWFKETLAGVVLDGYWDWNQQQARPAAMDAVMTKLLTHVDQYESSREQVSEAMALRFARYVRSSQVAVLRDRYVPFMRTLVAQYPACRAVMAKHLIYPDVQVVQLAAEILEDAAVEEFFMSQGGFASLQSFAQLAVTLPWVRVALVPVSAEHTPLQEETVERLRQLFPKPATPKAERRKSSTATALKAAAFSALAKVKGGGSTPSLLSVSPSGSLTEFSRETFATILADAQAMKALMSLKGKKIKSSPSKGGAAAEEEVNQLALQIQMGQFPLAFVTPLVFKTLAQQVGFKAALVALFEVMKQHAPLSGDMVPSDDLKVFLVEALTQYHQRRQKKEQSHSFMRRAKTAVRSKAKVATKKSREQKFVEKWAHALSLVLGYEWCQAEPHAGVLASIESWTGRGSDPALHPVYGLVSGQAFAAFVDAQPLDRLDLAFVKARYRDLFYFLSLNHDILAAEQTRLERVLLKLMPLMSTDEELNTLFQREFDQMIKLLAARSQTEHPPTAYQQFRLERLKTIFETGRAIDEDIYASRVEALAAAEEDEEYTSDEDWDAEDSGEDEVYSLGVRELAGAAAAQQEQVIGSLTDTGHLDVAPDQVGQGLGGLLADALAHVRGALGAYGLAADWVASLTGYEIVLTSHGRSFSQTVGQRILLDESLVLMHQSSNLDQVNAAIMETARELMLAYWLQVSADADVRSLELHLYGLVLSQFAGLNLPQAYQGEQFSPFSGLNYIQFLEAVRALMAAGVSARDLSLDLAGEDLPAVLASRPEVRSIERVRAYTLLAYQA